MWEDSKKDSGVKTPEETQSKVLKNGELDFAGALRRNDEALARQNGFSAPPVEERNSQFSFGRGLRRLGEIFDKTVLAGFGSKSISSDQRDIFSGPQNENDRRKN